MSKKRHHNIVPVKKKKKKEKVFKSLKEICEYYGIGKDITDDDGKPLTGVLTREAIERAKDLPR